MLASPKGIIVDDDPLKAELLFRTSFVYCLCTYRTERPLQQVQQNCRHNGALLWDSLTNYQLRQFCTDSSTLAADQSPNSWWQLAVNGKANWLVKACANCQRRCCCCCCCCCQSISPQMHCERNCKFYTTDYYHDSYAPASLQWACSLPMKKLSRVPVPNEQPAIRAQADQQICFFRVAQQRVTSISAVPTYCCDWLPGNKTQP